MRAALRERARSRYTQRRDDESNNHRFQDARHFHEPSSFSFSTWTVETRFESQTIHGCVFLHPFVSPSSSPCSGGIRSFAECFSLRRKQAHNNPRLFSLSRI